MGCWLYTEVTTVDPVPVELLLCCLYSVGVPAGSLLHKVFIAYNTLHKETSPFVVVVGLTTSFIP